MTKWTLAVALAAALCGLIATPALAQNTALTKLKPKTAESASTATVVVTNSRKADLVQLQATESGLVSWKKVLGALKSGGHARLSCRDRSTAASTCTEPSATASRWTRPTSTSAPKRR